jgi:hypothetical protein
MAYIFISYSRNDREFVFSLAEALTRRGCTVWWDRDIEHGKYFDRTIEQEIQKANIVIVIWSSTSRESNWCRAEAASALEHNKLLPISIQNAKPPMRFMHLHTGDMSAWTGDPAADEFELLCRDIRGYGVPINGPLRASEFPYKPLGTPKWDGRWWLWLASAGTLTVVTYMVWSLAQQNQYFCFTFAEAYRDAYTVFKREGNFWREYSLETGKLAYEFKETGRTRNFIELLNLTPRPNTTNSGSTMRVRLPMCGGAAQMSWVAGDPWNFLFDVYRE